MLLLANGVNLMKKIKPYVGIIATIIFFSTLINIFFIAPKKANADDTFKVTGGCLSDPYPQIGLPPSDPSTLGTSGRVADGMGATGQFIYFVTNNALTTCNDGDVAVGMGIAHISGNTPGASADGIGIILMCCTPVVFSVS
jgi:hypothetical protein